jgi:hypothetical protein
MLDHQFLDAEDTTCEFLYNDTPHYEPMVAKLRELFERFKGNGRVTFSYVTHLYWGNWGQGQP